MPISVKIQTFESIVSSVAEKYQEILDESVSRLLTRAGNSRGLKTENLRGRVSLSVEKYLFKDEPNPPKTEVKEFVDALNADDLCLIVACENGDETAWEEIRNDGCHPRRTSAALSREGAGKFRNKD